MIAVRRVTPLELEIVAFTEARTLPPRFLRCVTDDEVTGVVDAEGWNTDDATRVLPVGDCATSEILAVGKALADLIVRAERGPDRGAAVRAYIRSIIE